MFKGTGYNLNLTYNGMTNRIASPGYAYDADGNLTAMPGLVLSYNASGRLTQATYSSNQIRQYGYGPSGQRVVALTPPAQGSTTRNWTLWLYGPDGKIVSDCSAAHSVNPGDNFTVQCQTEYLYFRGQMFRQQPAPWLYNGRIEIETPSTHAALMVLDRVGSVLATSAGVTANRFYPYGEQRVAGGTGPMFATYYRDNGTTGLDYANQRYYSSQIGRFLTPDPYQASGGPADPQSWNRYSYTRGDPINRYDPAGLEDSMPAPELPPTSVAQPNFSPMEDMLLRQMLSSINNMGQYAAAYSRVMPLMMAERHQPTPRQRLLAARGQVHEAIYGTGDSVFGPEILDCMAGRESDWDPKADNGLGFRGMFQMSKAAWDTVYKGTKNSPAYASYVFDPKVSAAAAGAYLNFRLMWNVGKQNYWAGTYSDSDLKQAIRDYNGSDIAESYADQIWNCAQKLNAGDLDGALKAIGKP